MAQRYKPKFRFILVDKITRKFPKRDSELISERLMTSSLEFTYIFDDRDSQESKTSYYNALYRGIAEFEVLMF